LPDFPVKGAALRLERGADLTVDTVIGFGSPEDRAAFASDLQSAVAALVARYHHGDGGPHRLTVSSYLRREEPS
jgi:hypothetical protein